MQLAKNLYTVCGYAYSSQDNVYAIQAPHGVILVDTGLSLIHILFLRGHLVVPLGFVLGVGQPLSLDGVGNQKMGLPLRALSMEIRQ